MKVHFTASLNSLEKHFGAYSEVVAVIKDAGHQLVRDWLEEAGLKDVSRTKYSDAEWRKISEQTLDAVVQSDIVIIDASSPSFSLGYQAAVALNHKKPLLVLFQQGTENRELIYDSSYSLMETKVYKDHKDICNIVKTFIEMHDIDSKDMRFNMFLDRESYTYLNWEASKTGKTKAQIIREIIKLRSQEK